MFLEKSLEKLNVEDFDSLISNRIGEGQILDYKRAIPKDELLKIICAFANAQGGYILLGMKEDKGFPVERNGIEVRNQEEFIQTMDKKIEKFIAPSVKGVKYQFVEVENNLFIVCIYVPKSLDPFHGCNLTGNWIYYVRQNAQNMQFQPYELENRVRQENPEKILASYVKSRISRIRQGNCNKIQSESKQDPIFFLHAKTIFKSKINYLNKEMKQELHSFIKKYLYNPDFSLNPCFEGLVVNLGDYQLLLDQEGFIEFRGLADGSPSKASDSAPRRVFQKSIEEVWGDFFIEILLIINKHQKLSPLILSYTLINTKEVELGYINKSPMWHADWNRAQEVLKENEYIITGDPVHSISKESLLESMKNLFDRIWNAAGELHSPRLKDTAR